ncbi:glycoside hydrolase family 16 protein, partial [Mycena polygramma]
ILALSFATSAFSAIYQMSENIVGAGFYNSFNFEAIPDPTAGRVNYVDQATAVAANLTFNSNNTFVLRADHSTVLDPSGAGRNSVRLRSKNAYSTHVAVFDIEHMPQGCGTWPAVFGLQTLALLTFIVQGETDILEGVNDQGTDSATLHTAAGHNHHALPAPQLKLSPLSTGGQLDCDASINGNAGCGVRLAAANSYGPTFNANGGGWYAMERTNSFINVWFWARDDPSVPIGVKTGGSNVDTDNWGTPSANFPSTTCDIADLFVAHNIIINLTLC